MTITLEQLRNASKTAFSLGNIRDSDILSDMISLLRSGVSSHLDKASLHRSSLIAMARVQ